MIGFSARLSYGSPIFCAICVTRLGTKNVELKTALDQLSTCVVALYTWEVGVFFDRFDRRSRGFFFICEKRMSPEVSFGLPREGGHVYI